MAQGANAQSPRMVTTRLPHVETGKTAILTNSSLAAGCRSTARPNTIADHTPSMERDAVEHRLDGQRTDVARRLADLGGWNHTDRPAVSAAVAGRGSIIPQSP
jgi:hypothetical protein